MLSKFKNHPTKSQKLIATLDPDKPSPYRFLTSVHETKSTGHLVLELPKDVTNQIARVGLSMIVEYGTSHETYHLNTSIKSIHTAKDTSGKTTRYLVVSPKTEAQKVQRRSLFRVRTDIPLRLISVKLPNHYESNQTIKQKAHINWDNTLSHQSFDFKTIDISGGGISFYSSKPFTANDTFYVEFEILPRQFFKAMGKIKYSRKISNKADNNHIVGLQYLSLSEKKEDRLIRSVFKLQNKKAKKAVL